ncbi:hypothetical protein HMPREF1476_01518 [Sutterella wadsworthensis HGA0223]|jgi:hypothetical protein|uniref:Uncharacterized protein n=1 Tax=Sutterella wadsworthensis HGA0223 TaxID=1203554 RepID=S3BED5_9BURK|nr:hypothetical protein HMPREF1476_01518 [Sutterella wadsworthensis HGA0223]
MAELNFDSNKGVVIPETQDVRTDLAASQSLSNQGCLPTLLFRKYFIFIN